jgi:hypothetical protein
VATPALTDDLGFTQRIEDLTVEQFIPQASIEAFDVAVLPRAAGLDVSGFCTNSGDPTTSDPRTAPCCTRRAGDAAFATAASNTIFGAASIANLVSVMQNFVSNWKAFYTAHGVPGLANASAGQIDLAARGAAWGDMVEVALANARSTG